jgi:aminoglycoside/choline kinase family phosphotransferase
MYLRESELYLWAVQYINNNTPESPKQNLEIVSGDASFRRYFRLFNIDKSKSWIVVDAPPEKENSTPFIDIATIWLKHGIRVPKVLNHNLSHGFMLLEDFGDQLLFPLLTHQDAGNYYQKCLNTLINIQKLSSPLPVYNSNLLSQEMNLFTNWLCNQYLNIHLSSQTRTMLNDVFQILINNAEEQPQVTVHRDFHCRNIMVLKNKDIGIIDFQDAVTGPITYDPVSLLKDCYISWPRESVLIWLEKYFNKLIQQGMVELTVPFSKFIQWFDLMGMQRHLKIAGIFARLALRDGKKNYLDDIPQTCQYLLEASHLNPQFSEFNDWLTSVLLPALNAKNNKGPL